MNERKTFSERDTISKCILPAIESSGWQKLQYREEVTFTAGRIFVKGKQTKRGEQKRADIILKDHDNQLSEVNPAITTIITKQNHPLKSVHQL